MANGKIFYYTIEDNFSLLCLAHGIRSIMLEAKCESQIIPTSNDSCIIQCRNTENGGWWRKITGNSKALSVSLVQYKNQLSVQIGNTEWGDKAAGYVLAWLGFWPLAITASYGIYSQNELEKKVLTFIKMYMNQQEMYNR